MRQCRPVSARHENRRSGWFPDRASIMAGAFAPWRVGFARFGYRRNAPLAPPLAAHAVEVRYPALYRLRVGSSADYAIAVEIPLPPLLKGTATPRRAQSSSTGASGLEGQGPGDAAQDRRLREGRMKDEKGDMSTGPETIASMGSDRLQLRLTEATDGEEGLHAPQHCVVSRVRVTTHGPSSSLEKQSRRFCFG